MSHELPDATVAPHMSFTTVYAFGVSPVIVLAVMLKTELPVFVKVVGKIRFLTNFRFRVPKFKFAGMIFTVPAVRVIVTLASLVGSATEVAVSVTDALGGTVAGAA
jgi:hypothetical protein